MDIKLRARLSAYSKVDAIRSDGCGTHPTVSPSDVDTLFTSDSQPVIVSKNDVDTLFQEEETAPIVSATDIDSLFD